MSIADIGTLCLYLNFIICLYVAVAAPLGMKHQHEGLVVSAYRGVFIFLALSLFAVGLLIYLLAVRDFSVEYVVRYTSSRLPIHYAIPALWAGNDGSLLLWVFILSIWTVLALQRHRKLDPQLTPYVMTILMGIALFFLSLLIILANPFRTLPFIAQEGHDLNPQLQHPAMLFHPPTLYTGYVGLSIPFAFAMAALWTKKLDAGWLQSSRRWVILPWLFLSIGNIMGAWWAYTTLGWGGYWAWDPVENASFMPWLMSTAFLHSVMIQEKKGMLKVWNLSLVILTFALTIFGTFLTRSGVLSSVHSFALSPTFGAFFLTFLAIILAFSFGLLYSRRELLQAEHRLESYLSRESSFLFNNLVFVSATFAILWGTLFPILSEAVRGTKITVGPPFFNKVLTPIWLFLLILTGIGPLISWRKATPQNLLRNFLYPTTTGLIVGIALFILGMNHAYAVAFFAGIGFVAATIFQEFYRGVRARWEPSGKSFFKALATLVGKNRRRYGGYIVHVAILVIVAGVTASSAFKVEKEIPLQQGQAVSLKHYTFKLLQFKNYQENNREVFAAEIDVTKGKKHLGTLQVKRDYYPVQEQVWTRATIYSTPMEDLYLTLADFSDTGDQVTLTVHINPMVQWIWFGAIVLILGFWIIIGHDTPRGSAP
jgi:cytochrome c-type biogenesis protein CcmF